jgi:type II secretory pathway predicted ATPase ExeA
MDESCIGWRDRPFRPFPSTACYYPSTTHEQAIAQLLQAINNDEGLALLTGGPGTGKTTVCLCLLERMGDKYSTAFIGHCHFSQRSDLLQAILYDLALPYESQTEEALRLRFIDTALKNYEAGKRTVLIIDEAQHLSPDLLEEIRLLSNLDGNRGKAVQIVLAAQPSIIQTIQSAELAVLSQRLGVRAQLEPLGVHEAGDYLAHHLRSGGVNGRTSISDEALDLLARRTSGVPRLLNRAAGRALEMAREAGSDEMDAEAAIEALDMLGLGGVDEGSSEEEELSSDAKADELDIPRSDESESPWTERSQIKQVNGSAAKEGNRARRLFASPRKPA